MNLPPTHRRPTRTSHRSPLAVDPHTLAAVARDGWTDSALRHAVAAGDALRLGRGVIAAARLADGKAIERVERESALLRLARGSSLRCERAVISHQAAAIAQGAPTFGPLGRPCLTVQAGTALRDLTEVHLHRATLRPEDTSRIDGHELTTPPRTIIDVGREHGVEPGVVIADYFLHQGIVTQDQLAVALAACTRWPGRKAAAAVVAAADARAESPLESVSRLRLVAAGLPVPELQVEFCDLNGEYITRSDFYWPEFGVVGEADGASKYDPEGRRRGDEERTQTALERTGLEVVRWEWPDLFAFSSTVREIERAFLRGARPGSPRRRWGIVLPRRP